MKDYQNLPLSEPAAPPQAQTNPAHRILMVEDDICMSGFNTEALRHCGYEVTQAIDGAVAWEALNDNSFDLVITDNRMPRLTGLELLKKLRAARMDLPVIMATGILPKEEFTQSPWLRPAAVMIKPYTIEELIRTVKKVLREADGVTGAPWQCTAPATLRILVVDQDCDFRRLYTESLMEAGYSVVVAEDGATGWARLQADSYQLLITEHELPDLTGVELVGKLRSVRMNLPVVMTAGRLPVHELARNPRLQLTAALVKPFAIETLLDTVKRTLGPPGGPDQPVDSRPEWLRQPSASGLPPT